MKTYLSVLRRPIAFSGRANRKEFWTFAAVQFLVIVVLQFPDRLVDFSFLGAGVATLAYLGLTLLPAAGATVRRLHDSDHSGLWVLLIVIPGLGLLILLGSCIFPGTPGANRYGAVPS